MNQTKQVIVIAIFVLLLCFTIYGLYALQGNTINEIGDLIFGFLSFIIEGFKGILFSILDFFANLIFGV